VDTAIGIPGAYGARMTGGGFGGCTVNLLDAGTEDRFESEIRSAYGKRFGIAAETYRVQPSAGAGKIDGE